MNNLKKALGAAALVSVLAMTACGNDGSTSSSVSDTKTSATSENMTESQTTTSAATSKSTTTSIVTTTVATTTTVAESTTVKTEAAANGSQGQDQDVDLSKRKDYIEQDESNTYGRCSIFGVNKKGDWIFNDLSSANADNSLQGIVNKFGLTPIEGEGADYEDKVFVPEGGIAAFGFSGKGYYTIADDDTSTKIYLMTDENNEVVGIALTDFAKSSHPIVGGVEFDLLPNSDRSLNRIRDVFENYPCIHTHYNFDFTTDGVHTGSYIYERYDDKYYSTLFSMPEWGDGIDTYAVIDNRFINENPDLKVKE